MNDQWMVIAAEAQAKFENAMVELEKLRKFYRGVADLTVNHDVIDDYYATVKPSKLAVLLEEIDPKWYVKKEK